VTDDALGQQRPRLRPLDIRRLGDVLVLRDPLGLCPQELLVPVHLAPLLALLDGTRDLRQLQASFQLLTGRYVSLSQLEELVARLDTSLLLDTPSFQEACQRALEEFRSAPFRPPALAGQVYPGDAQALSQALDGYLQAAPPSEEVADAVGIISPHIDYGRGWRVYAQVWGAARRAILEAELVIALGTDHTGGPGAITPTHQCYSTPYGVLPTYAPAVEDLAKALGEEAFAQELHHRREHSLELALVWLHHLRGGRPIPVVPVLCGSFAPYVEGDLEPASDGKLEMALRVLASHMQGKRTLVVAAADLSHVGPTFGDPFPWGLMERAHLRGADGKLLAAMEAVDAESFLGEVRACRDRYRICGLPPIYMALRLLAGHRGRVLAYEQCPADPQGGSLVSIAGALIL